jgi:hypothetical protein
MKRGSGIQDRDDKTSGVEILMVEPILHGGHPKIVNDIQK